MLTDYHSHFLPAMDDGPEDAWMSIEMLGMWKAQGVDRVIATPHFYPHRESIESFLSRRESAFDSLGMVIRSPRTGQGAEVRVEKGISEVERMRELTLAGSRYILLELPYAPFKEWMTAEIYNLKYNFGLIPVIAHIDRYTQWYAKDDMSQVLSVQGAVLQINNEALFKRSTRKFALKIIRGGLPVIFGSDAHNTGERPPNVEAAWKILRSNLKETEYLALVQMNESLADSGEHIGLK